MEKLLADGSIRKESDEWYEMVNAINDVTNAIDDSALSLAEYNNASRQLRWDEFDDAMETMKRLNSETDYYLNMMSGKKMVNDNGEFTEYENAVSEIFVRFGRNVRQAVCCITFQKQENPTANAVFT